jgi:RNA polymerase sigma-70 factor (ECF subfamily)
MVDTNETLLERLRHAEAHDAWKEFYDLYWGVILRYARKVGLNEHQAEDVLQETMMVLMRQLPEFRYDRGKGRFRNFLLTIVHRKAVAVLRRARRAAADSLKEGDAVDGHRAVINAAAERRWKEAVMEEALRTLKAHDAIDARTWAVFQAYALEQLPATEVAEKFGLSPNAVYQIRNRMLRRLRSLAGEHLRDSGAASEGDSP